MKLIRFGPPGRERPGVILDHDQRVDLSGVIRDYDQEFFAGDGAAALGRRVPGLAPDLPRIPAGARWGPPFARPSKIICVGLNFRDHAEESGAAPPSEPVLFMKATTAIAGPFDPVVIPRGAEKLDWEVELAVVIGRTARSVPREAAMGCVAGYALHNDYSERSFQLERGGQWVKGKSFDSFGPIGPWLLTADELPDPGRLDMWLAVNGTPRQRSNTANMIFDVATLVSYISEFMTLLPGDMISTGTPAGVALGMKPPAYLRPGDAVELGIERLGSSRQDVVAAS